MKNVLLILLLLACSSSYSQARIKVFGKKYKQKQLCSELGSARKCNPCSFGNSKILQGIRWPFPNPSTIKTHPDSVITKETYMEYLAETFIGGDLVDDLAPVPVSDDVEKLKLYDDGYIDIHSGEVAIKLKDTLTRHINVDLKVNEILSKLEPQLSQLGSQKEDSIKKELENYYKTIKKKGVLINLTYHSIKLNGKFLQKVKDVNEGPWYNLTKEIRYRPRNENLKNMNFKTIWGMGIIEYNYKLNQGSVIDFKFNTPDQGKIFELVKIEVKKDVENIINLDVPFKYDLAFVSTAPAAPKK